jgi:hypothetical protein
MKVMVEFGMVPGENHSQLGISPGNVRKAKFHNEELSLSSAVCSV